MWDMKQDMAGSAVVVASLKAAAQQKLNLNVVGIVGLVENMPSGSATRPGDIVTSLSGKTVEILNTDAEGRLVLGDCLTYVEKEYKPERIVDLATLTGAIVVALGNEMAGLFSNDDVLSELLSISGEQSGEELWRFPLTDAYRKLIKSDMADVKTFPTGALPVRLPPPASSRNFCPAKPRGRIWTSPAWICSASPVPSIRREPAVSASG